MAIQVTATCVDCGKSVTIEARDSNGTSTDEFGRRRFWIPPIDTPVGWSDHMDRCEPCHQRRMDELQDRGRLQRVQREAALEAKSVTELLAEALAFPSCERYRGDAHVRIALKKLGGLR